MKTKLFLSIVVIQLLIILFLGFSYLNKKNQKILGEVAINPIPKEELVFPESGELKYFYEPIANSVVKDSNDWLPEGVNYTINADSLNERFDYEKEKSEGTFRIITLGDSFTYGLFVNTQDNYPEQLEDWLNSQLNCRKFEVINLGMRGYDIQYSAHRFKIRGKKYNPDLVLWFLKSDDFLQIFDLMYDRVEEIKEEAFDPDVRREYIEKKGEYFPWEMTQEEFFKEHGEERVLRAQEGFLEDFFQDYQGEVVLFTYSDTEEKYKEAMRRQTEARGNAYLYDGIVYQEIDKFPDSHFKPKGYVKLAKELFNYLTEEKIVYCD